MMISKLLKFLVFYSFVLVAEATNTFVLTANDFPYDRDVITFNNKQKTYYAVIAEVRKSNETRTELEEKLSLKAKGSLSRFIAHGDASLAVYLSQFTPYKFWESESVAGMIFTIDKKNVSIEKSNKRKKKKNNIESILKNSRLMEGIQILQNEENTYLISMRSAEYDSSSAQSRVDAIRKTKTVTASELSKFINGTTFSTREVLNSIRVIKATNKKSIILENKEIYNELISAKSSGTIKDVKSLIWRDSSSYYGVSYIQIK